MLKTSIYYIQNENVVTKHISMFAFILLCIILVNKPIQDLFIYNVVFEFDFDQKEETANAVLSQVNTKVQKGAKLFIEIIDDWIALIIIISLFITSFLLYHNNRIKHRLIKTLKERKQEIKRQHEEIQIKNFELLELNERLNEFNQYLENKVVERNLLLESQNRRIIKYAFITAHKFRAPLARILGLVLLIDLSNDKIIDETILNHLKTSAEDLDKIIHKAQDLLNDEN